MSQQFVEKIIGAWYIIENGKMFAADIYEGNYYKLMDGNIQKTVPLVQSDYDRVVQQYMECVKKEQRIESAYEKNKKMFLDFTVPEITADPEAAEKEWYIRTHPQVVHTPEPVKKKKKGLFGRKEKKNIGIKCLSCGHVNEEGQKFCGECGKKLPSADEEITNTSVQDKKEEPVQTEAVVLTENGNEEKKNIENKEAVKTAEPKKEEVKAVKEVKAESAKEDSDAKEEPNRHEELNPVEENTDSKTEVPAEEAEEEAEEAENSGLKKKRKQVKFWKIFLIVLVMMIIGVGSFALAFYFSGGSNKIIFDSEKIPVSQDSEQPEDNYVVIKLKRDVAQNSKITEADIDGALITAEQYEKYSVLSTYVDKDGQTQKENLILWDDRDTVLGKYAARSLQEGTILYDTAVTTEHVVAEKNFVDVEVNGEGDTLQVESDVLPGNTRIQIVAIIQTDGGEPSQVLLSEMMLQDRSLQSIFDSAGEDILKKLSEEGNKAVAETKDTSAQAQQAVPQQNAPQQAPQAEIQGQQNQPVPQENVPQQAPQAQNTPQGQNTSAAPQTP